MCAHVHANISLCLATITYYGGIGKAHKKKKWQDVHEVVLPITCDSVLTPFIHRGAAQRVSACLEKKELTKRSTELIAMCKLNYV